MHFKNTLIDWPLDTNIIRRQKLSNTFGNVRRNADNSPRVHQGWDFYAKAGTRCYSISDGVVKYAGMRKGLGLLLVVSIAGTDYYTAYAHLSKITVAEGDRVHLGQVIAYTGNSGNAHTMKNDDEHLHLEIRTAVLTGLGLEGRISPLEVFGKCPLHGPEFREFE